MENDINKFEKTILDPEKTGQIKYRTDVTMESDVKYQFLCESYGKERVDSLLAQNNFSILDLCGEDNFAKISSMLLKK